MVRTSKELAFNCLPALSYRAITFCKPQLKSSEGAQGLQDIRIRLFSGNTLLIFMKLVLVHIITLPSYIRAKNREYRKDL